MRQSGLPSFRFVDLAAHRDLLAAARAEAKRVLRSDPILSGERGKAARVLLHLFERHDAVRLLAAG